MTEVKINKMPTPTWSWLKMDYAKLSIEDNLFTSMENMLPSVRGLTDAIEYREDGLEEAEKLPELTSGLNNKGGQIFEESLPLSIRVKKGQKIEKPLVLEYDLTSQNAVSTTQVIRAEENSELTVIILTSSEKGSAGFNTLRTQIYAEAYSKVHVIKVQLLGDKFLQIDESESRCAEGAHIEVSHVILGAGKTYLGVGNDLAEYKSTFKSRLSYFCKNDQELDLNYIVLHHGKKSECQMNVAGTLKDSAKKTYRGTIDFKNGCAGSVGEEQEEALLLSEKVVNNSIPIILCDEEDVSGEHGATIGRLGEDVLFYMQNRGIDSKAAENLIARAKVQSTVDFIDDEEVLSKTELFMDSIFGKL